MISANNDREIGNLIADAMEAVGNDGVITVEEGKTAETTYEVVEGMQFDKGYLSPYFINDMAEMKCTLEDAYILLYEKKISNIRNLVPLLEKVTSAGKQLFIIAEDVDTEALTMLVLNKLRGVLDVCAVKAPGFGDRRKAMLQDIAILTGAQVISEDLGIKLDSVELSQLGQAKQINVDKDTTVIIDGKGDRDAIKARTDLLRRMIDETDSQYDREKYQERLAKLSGGVAIIQVGAHTEAEMKQKKDRVDDALHATRAAAEEGILPGGGVSLLRCKPAVEKARKDARGDEKIGFDVLIALFRLLCAKSSRTAAQTAWLSSMKSRKKKARSATTPRLASMKICMKPALIDPLKVVRATLSHAASVAASCSRPRRS